MAIGDRPLDLITEADLLELVSNSTPELKVLEFKRELPGRSDNDKKEFLYDAASFANAIGGDSLKANRNEMQPAPEYLDEQQCQ